MQVSWRRAQHWAPWALLLLTHHCGPKREVFATSDANGPSLGGSQPVPLGPGGGMTTAGGANLSGLVAGGGFGGFGIGGGACAVDADCPSARVCIEGQCAACGE